MVDGRYPAFERERRPPAGAVSQIDRAGRPVGLAEINGFEIALVPLVRVADLERVTVESRTQNLGVRKRSRAGEKKCEDI